jgi:hypothetical protein
MRLGAIPVVLASLVGCHAIEALEAPPLPGARAALIVLSEGADVLAVRAVDLDAESWPPFDARGERTLHVLGYACPLARLGLSPGPQALGDGATIEVLPPPSHVVARALDGDGAWTTSVTVPAEVEGALRRLPLPPGSRCAAVGAQYVSRTLRFPADGRGPPAFAVALGDGRALTGTYDGRLYLVDRVGNITPVATAPRGARFRGADRSSAGGVWLVSAAGDVARGPAEGPHARVTTTEAPWGLEVDRLAVLARDEGGREVLYAEGLAGNDRRLWRFDAGAWRELAHANHGGIYVPRVIEGRPGEVLSTGTATVSGGVLRYVDGVVEQDRLRTPDEGISSFARHDALELVLARSDGTFDLRTTTGWEHLDGGLPMRWIRVVLPEGDGFAYGGSGDLNFGPSTFTQYHPSIGFCRTFQNFTDYAAIFAPELEPGLYLLVQLAGFDSPMDLALLERVAPATDCSAP